MVRYLCSTTRGSGSWNLMESLYHVIDHRLRDAGVKANPENVVHYKVGVFQIANHAPLNVAVGGLAQQIAAEQQARGDVSGFQKTHHLAARDRGVRAHRKRKTEPAWFRMRGGFGKNEDVVEVA